MAKGMINPVYDTEEARLQDQLATAAALRKTGLQGNTGEGYHGGRVFIVGNPLGNIASGLAGAYMDSKAREGLGGMEQARRQQRDDFMAAMPQATETVPQAGPMPDGGSMPDVERNMNPRALAQATQQWAANAPPGMESVQQFALQQALTAPEKQAALESQQQARKDQLDFQAQQARQLQQERLDAQVQRDRERAQDKADNLRLAASLRPGTSDIDREIKQTKLDLLKNPAAAKLSPTDMKELYDTDEMVQSSKNSVDLLNQAKGYSKDAYSGYFALPRAQAKSFAGGSKEADATIQLNNILTGQGLESLKATFGAAPTEGERKILLDMQASADKTPAQRKEIIDRAVAAAERRIQFNSQKAEGIRGRTYATPAGAPTSSAPSGPVDFGSLK